MDEQVRKEITPAPRRIASHRKVEDVIGNGRKENFKEKNEV